MNSRPIFSVILSRIVRQCHNCHKHNRLIMLLTGEESIREVITFPMNKNAQDLMMDAPTTVSQKQLDDVHILINKDHL